MGWSKRAVVKKAYGVCGLSDDANLSPEDFQEGMSSLDAMMAEWDSDGIHLGYPIPTTDNGGNLDDDSGIPQWATRAVYLNLGVELAEALGREISPKIAGRAQKAYNGLLARECMPLPFRQPATMPAGAGAKQEVTRPFLVEEDNSILAEDDSELEFEQE